MPAVRVAAALQAAPRGIEAAQLIDEVRERARGGERVPVPQRLGHPELRPHVVGQVRQRVAPARARLGRQLLVAAGERHGLERYGVDLVDVLAGEADHRPDLVAVDRVDDGHHQRDVDPRGVEVLDRPQLDVEQIPDRAVLVVLVAQPIELQVGKAQAGAARPDRELRILGEADAVRRALDGEVTGVARIGHGVEEDRRDRRLAARELDRQLAPRTDGQRVVQDLSYLGERELVDVADLVRIHEARVAHHVAAVRQVDRQHRAAAVADRRRPVVVELVLGHAEVAAGVQALDAPQERRVDRQDVRGRTVPRALLLHVHAVVALDDVRRDLARMAVDEDAPVEVAADDRLFDLDHAAGAQGVGRPREAELRKRALALAQHGSGGPRRRERAVRNAPVQPLGPTPQHVGERSQAHASAPLALARSACARWAHGPSRAIHS